MVFWALTDTLVALQCLPVASSGSNCSNLSQVVFYRRKLAAWRARLNGYLLRRKLATEKAPEETNDAPLPRDPHLLVDGEVPVDEAASGRAPQPGPSRPDGSFDPHRGRGLWGAHSPERSDAMKPSSSNPTPATPPMPWPFQYPHRLPPQPWAALKDGERLDLPLIGGWVGQGLLQAGYTLSKGVQLGGSSQKFLAAEFHGHGVYVKLGGLALGAHWGADGVRIWEKFSLPMFPSRVPDGFVGKATPTLTADLKIQGPLGWNTTYTVRYEDAYTVEAPHTGQVSGTSGAFVSIAPVRMASVAFVAYVAYVTASNLSSLGGTLWKVVPVGQ